MLVQFVGMLVFASASLAQAALTPPADFTVAYNAKTNGSEILGLTTSIAFHNFAAPTPTATEQFTNDDGTYEFDGTGLAKLTFDVTITATWDDFFDGGRVSAFGFATDPNVIATVTGSRKYPKGTKTDTGVVFSPNDFSPDTLFGSVEVCGTGCSPGGSNFLGSVDICFTDNNCTGGGGGGPRLAVADPTYPVSVTGHVTLWFAGSATSVNFSDFYVRYQSLPSPYGSAFGTGTEQRDPVVPEPSFYGLVAAGLSGLYLYNRRHRSA